MDYFELGSKQDSELRFMFDRTDTSEYFISKQAEETKQAFNDVSLPSLDIKSEQDTCPSSESDLKLQDQELDVADNILLSKINQIEPLVEKPLTGTVPVCRLCAQEILDEEMTYLHETSSFDTTTIVDKINACLPISVSLEDSLPKQICSECLINVESSYLFSLSVTSAEEKLRNLQFCSNAENMNCPLCCEGCMEAVPPEVDLEDESSDEFSQVSVKSHVKSDNLRSENRTLNSSVAANLQPRKRGRPRKDDQDQDWTIDEDMEPARKKRATASNRGRPKGSRNRTTKMKKKNMDCFICHSKFDNFEDALSHTLNAHCDNMNETFPCPLCQNISRSEEELRDHVETHNDNRELFVIRCNICGIECGHVTILHEHVLKTHATLANIRCPLCQYKDSSCEGVLTHVFQQHQDPSVPDLPTCPVCTLGKH